MDIIPRNYQAFLGRAGYYQWVPHAYWLGGYNLKTGPSVDLDANGLDWFRTLILEHRTAGYAYQIVNPEDWHVLGVAQHPNYDDVVAMYGKPVEYETVPAEPLKARRR